jgi:hypothetical protein
LSESYKTAEHSYSGTAEQKSAASTVWFQDATQVDFLPKQILKEFPQLNGIIIADCKTLKTVKNDLFTEDFGAIQYLGLWDNKIAAIEPNAFQHLPKLKWIHLGDNQLRSLPHQLFKNNPELVAIFLSSNKIKSVTPDFFNSYLHKLRLVDFDFNPCHSGGFDCESEFAFNYCLLEKGELDKGLATCYSNCLSNGKCAAKSGKLDKLSSKHIEKNLNLIVASGHTAALVEKGYSNLLIEKGYGRLIAEASN